MIFIPGLILLLIVTLIIYSTNKGKFTEYTRWRKTGKFALYFLYTVLGTIILAFVTYLLKRP
jgi:hypothetical protein